MESIIAMRSAGVGLVLATSTDALPEVLHWGPELGEMTPDDARALQLTACPPPTDNLACIPRTHAIIPEERWGWRGRPGLIGHRGGRDWSPAWSIQAVRADGRPCDGFVQLGSGTVEIDALAQPNGLALKLTVELLPSGLVRVRADLTNTGREHYDLQELTLRLPVPSQARELMDFAGRWGLERTVQRREFVVGAHRREQRHGRTGADSSYILSVGEAGFGYDHGEIWAAHVAWSGNHVEFAEREMTGAQSVGGGELLLPGEIRLAEGEQYSSPWVYFNHAVGLDRQAARFHEHLRRLPVHPSSDRPVSLNVWEAVYFDHNLARLTALAERAAELGVERVILDDGWFGSRRDDTSGLGDWVVSRDVWPEGLHPFVDLVHELGMQFGLWFEPEMVNINSDLARAHPDWILQLPDRLPIEGRHQQVLDLSNPDAYAHVLGQMSAIFAEYAIDYVKWDHNRDLVDAGHLASGRPGVAAQTRAFYRLLDELRGRYPHLEIESCSSGGARIDLEVMERAERVWVSDNIDPEDRQRMLWWTGQMLPPELMGSHVASGRNHITGRWHDVEFRAATAVFGHFGIEWDLTLASEDELASLAWWIGWYKRHRRTLHTGRVVRWHVPEEGVLCKGVVTERQAIYSLVQLEGTACQTLGRLRLPGLDPVARYRISVINRQPVPSQMQVPWLRQENVEMQGAQLFGAGLAAPIMRPGTAVLIICDRIC